MESPSGIQKITQRLNGIPDPDSCFHNQLHRFDPSRYDQCLCHAVVHIEEAQGCNILCFGSFFYRVYLCGCNSPVPYFFEYTTGYFRLFQDCHLNNFDCFGALEYPVNKDIILSRSEYETDRKTWFFKRSSFGDI